MKLAVVAAAHPVVDALVEAARRGAEGRGASVTIARVDGAAPDGLLDDVLAADALLLAAPITLFGLPGPLKTWLDGLLAPLHRGALVPRSSRMQAGYLAVHAPDDPEIPELFHKQMRAMFQFLGFPFRGSAVGFAAPGASEARDPKLVRVAERLGAVLAGDDGHAGYPIEYLAGIRRFNQGAFWEAHEEWETLWLEADDEDRLYFQGLIQVAASLHHLERENWGGMAALLRQAVEKLEGYRPRKLGLDVDAFLAEIEPWRLLAEARDGRRPIVMRRPEGPPRIVLDDGPEG